MISIDSSSAPVRQLLGKTIFLLALATGSRVSELVGLSRNKDHVMFLESGTLVLHPDPTFLAKNEVPSHRRPPIRIPSLPGSDTSLCPVQNLRHYLDRTSAYQSGPLFRNITSGAPLKAAGIRSAMTALIKVSNPQSIPATHDIRKLATSYAFFELMSFQDLTSYTGWHSPSVFLQHYLKSVEELPVTFVATGAVIPSLRSTRNQE